MKALIYSFFLAAVAIVHSQAAHAKKPMIAGWFYDFDNGNCKIWRYKEDRMFVHFDNDWREEPSFVIQVESIKTKPEPGQLVQLEQEFEIAVAEGRKYDGTAGFGAPMPDGILEWLSSRSSVQMTVGDQGPVTVDLKGLDQAFAAYQSCLGERAQGSEQLLAFTDPIFGGIGQKEEVRSLLVSKTQHLPITFHFHAYVEASGQLRDCETRGSTGFEDLDERLCNLLVEHGEFQPARNRSGEAVAANYQGVLEFK